MHYENCLLCPRKCGVDRTSGQRGFCGCPPYALVSKVLLHQWEEPALAGAGGSGAVFFGGCSLGCIYCQNRAISAEPVGEPVDGQGLRRIFEALLAQGAENIDLVTPSQYLPTLLEALHDPLPVPVVYNCGGYERRETVDALSDKVDIWLPDLKYADDALGFALSGVKNYFATATAAIGRMVQQAGAPQWENGRLKKGVLVRHLILPGQVDNSLRVLDWLGENFAPGEILVSLMRQYTPMPGMAAPYDRKITDEEYDSVLSWMYLNNLQGFVQEAASAETGYIPEF